MAVANQTVAPHPRWALSLALLMLVMLMAPASTRLSAHVGSPDAYFDGHAGPYHVLVAVRAPAVVPGIADIEVRVLDGSPRDIHVVPLRLTGPGAEHAPVPDRALPSDTDPRLFRAGLWMMVAGPWQVRITIDGDGGPGQVSVPVDALASRTLRMDTKLVLTLLPFALFLVFGFIALVGASVGTAQTDPGQPTPPYRVRRARIARVIAAGVVILVVVSSDWWWGREAKAYDEYIYKPLQLQPQLQLHDVADGANAANGVSTLHLTLHDPGWLESRVIDDLVPDHGHRMHLFAVRTPALDRLLHLHPQQQSEPDAFLQPLPALAAGRYRLFADVVHATGLPETAVADLTFPEIATRALNGDDSEAVAPANGAFQPDRVIADLPAGSHMTWTRQTGALKAKTPYLLEFHVADADGTPARDLTPYMGMPGHAIVVRRDLAVFAHVHPSGTAPMATLALTVPPPSADDAHAQHMEMSMPMPMVMSTLAPTVTFPYGFPSPGEYRLFIQIKRTAGGVQTGVFDVRVE